jgi:histidine triad (HIT) family protein
MDNCIFCKIAKGEISKDFTYQDDELMVFPDIHPKTSIHLLIVPRKHIADFMDTPAELLSKMCALAKKLVKEKDLDNKGFRLVINGGGAQIIQHLHLHLLGPLGNKADF